ncbi:MAG: glycosyltransferase family 2 protein [Candidatus Thermoplasmatota archaeon]
MAALRVSVVIPTMNEEESIGAVIDGVRAALDDWCPGGYEILVVDTNSRDRTVEIAAEKGARVISEPRRGYGRAYKTGFGYAQGEYIATLDADCTYPADALPLFLEMLEKEGLDFVTGDRITKLEKGVMGVQHHFGNWVLTKTSNLLFGTRLRDSQSGMWVLRREILSRLELRSDGMALSEEIKIEVHAKGMRMREVPIHYAARKGEVKLNTWKDGIGNLRYLWRKKLHR